MLNFKPFYVFTVFNKCMVYLDLILGSNASGALKESLIIFLDCTNSNQRKYD